MPSTTNEEREDVLDKITDLVALGFTSPTEIARQQIPGATDRETIKNYISIAQRRLRNRFKHKDIENIRRRESAKLASLEKKLLVDLSQAKAKKDLKAAAEISRTITKIMERRSKMLGLDAPQTNFNLNVEAGEKQMHIAVISDEKAKQIAENLTRIHAELNAPQPDRVGGEPATEARSEEVTPALRPAVPPAPPDGNSTSVPQGDTGAQE